MLSADEGGQGFRHRIQHEAERSKVNGLDLRGQFSGNHVEG